MLHGEEGRVRTRTGTNRVLSSETMKEARKEDDASHRNHFSTSTLSEGFD